MGEGVDSLVFYPLAFWALPMLVGFDDAVWSLALFDSVMVNDYLLEVAFEVAATRVTYALVSKLERAEGVDVYDHDTDFNPFRLD